MIPFLELSEKLQAEITSGGCAPVLPSIAQLVKCYGVGASTVKRTINRLKELNYVQGMQGKCVKVNPLALGNPFFRKNVVIYTHLPTLGNHFYLQVIDCLRQHLEEVNCFVHIFNSPSQLKNCGFTPDVLIMTEIFDELEVTELEGYCPRKHIIKFNHNDPDYCCVGTDNIAAGYMAMDYLHRQCGHQEIGIISSQLDYVYGVCRLRYDGAMSFQQEHGGMKLYNYEVKDLNEAAQAAAVMLREHPQISAIFVAMDFMALGVYNYCHSSGRIIPDDVSILGFDNREFAPVLLPALTTYQENVKDIFRFIHERISCIINGDNQMSSVLVKPVLIERNSVKKNLNL